MKTSRSLIERFPKLWKGSKLVRDKTFQRKIKEIVVVLGIFSDPKVGLCGL
jgi:hypothetical protein